MAYEWLNNLSTKKMKAKGDYGVRVARPGFDASTCADNLLLFNSGWPILQLCALIDMDKDFETYTRYQLADGTWSDTLPSGYNLIATFTESDKPKFGINKKYVRMYVETKDYYDTTYTYEVKGYVYRRKKHYMGYTPFFMPADDVTGTTSNKLLLFSVDIEADVDYPYTEEALPFVSFISDYGMKSSSIFGPKVPGLSTGQFSKLVQAVKTQDTANYVESNGNKIPIWSPLADAPATTPSTSPLLPFEAYGFAIVGETLHTTYDDKDGGYYTPLFARALSDGGTGLAYVYSLLGYAASYFPKSSLVILRSPLVTPEYEEKTI